MAQQLNGSNAKMSVVHHRVVATIGVVPILVDLRPPAVHHLGQGLNHRFLFLIG